MFSLLITTQHLIVSGCFLPGLTDTCVSVVRIFSELSPVFILGYDHFFEETLSDCTYVLLTRM